MKKKSHPGSKRESGFFPLGSLSQTPARGFENAFPGDRKQSNHSAFCKGAPTYLIG